MRSICSKRNKLSIRAIILPLFFILTILFSCFVIFDGGVTFGHYNNFVKANAEAQQTSENYDLPTEYSLYNVPTILNYFNADNRRNSCANLPQNVGNQRQVGICWAFATLTAFESSLYQMDVVDTSVNLNFSELNLAYTTQVVNRNSSISGGTFSLGYEYISSEQGPVYEQAGESVGDSNWKSDSIAANFYKNNYYATAQKANYTALEAHYFPSRSSFSTQDEILSNRNNIKNHIKTHGAVTASIYYDGNQVIDNLIYNYSGAYYPNHTITLVGWDDDFTYPVAGGTVNPGAYIAQNSHGTDFGVNGYFYIMYEDVHVEESVAGFVRVGETNEDAIVYNNLENTSFDNQFLTDNGGSYGFSYIEPTVPYTMANIYQLKDVNNQYISKIKVPTVTTLEDSSQFYVYVLPNLSKDDVSSVNAIVEALSSNFSSAIQVENVNSKNLEDVYLFEANQTTYYTVDVKHEISLTGDYFAVFVKYVDGPIYVKSNFNVNDGLQSKNLTYYSTLSTYSTWQQFKYSDGTNTNSCILPMYVITDYELGTIDYNSQDIQKEYDAYGVSPNVVVNNLNASSYKISYSLDGTTWFETIDVKNAGIYTVYFKIEADFYETVQDSFELIISQKKIVVTPAFQYKNYGDEDSVIIDYNKVGAIETPKFSGSLTRESGENTGYYDIYLGSLKLVDNGDFIASNYELVFGDGVDKYQIKPRALYVVAEATSKIYGEVDPEIKYTYSNQIETPSFSGVLSRVSGEDVGKYNVIQNGLTLVDNPSSGFYKSNYTLVFSALDNGSKFEITPRYITIIPSLGQEKVYQQEDPTFNYTYSNVLSGQIPVFTGALSRVAGEDVGNYRYLLGTLDLVDNDAFLKNNYLLALSNDDITFTINYGLLTGCIVEDKTVFYSGEQVSLKPRSQTIEDVEILYSQDNTNFVPGNIAFKDAGTYNVYYKFQKANYNPVTIQATLTINQYNLIITPNDNQSKVYGESDPTINFTDNQTIPNENPVYAGALSRAVGEDVGKYLITRGDIFLVSDDNFNALNYNLLFNNTGNIEFEIVTREIVVYADKNQSKTYGFDDLTLTYSVENALTEQTPSFAGCLERESGEDVGLYKINIGSLVIVNSHDNTFKASNYTLLFGQEDVDFEITKANITLTVTDVSSYYSDSVITSFTSTISGDYVDGDQLDVEYNCEVDKFSLKGEYQIYATVKNERAKANYNITIADGTYTIMYKIYQVDFIVLGNVVKRVNVEHFSKVDSADVPIVDVPGYTFKGWEIVGQDGSRIVFDTANDDVRSDLLLTASMEVGKYSISLYTNNESGDVVNYSYTIKDADFDLAIPKKKGYTFEGWYNNANFEGEPISTIIQGSYGDKVFYAKWKINSYHITLPQNTVGFSIVYEGSLTKEYNSSFEFNIVLEAPYSQSINTIVVTYVVDNAGESKQVESDNLNYVLQSVEGNTEIIVSNVQINTYYVKFIVDGEVRETLSKTHGEFLSFSEYPELPSKENYDQIPPKWSISNGIYEVKQNYDIVAKYTPNVYEIVVVTQYGTKATQLITYGEDINQEQLRSQLALNMFEYLVFDESIGNIDGDLTINVKVESRIYILYIVLGCIGALVITLILFFTIRKIKRRKFNWWGYATDISKFDKKK